MEAQKFHQLPEPVKALVIKICQQQNQPLIDDKACELLTEIGEEKAMIILKKIDGQPIKRSFSGFITYLVNDYKHRSFSSPNASTVTRVWSPSSDSPSTCLYNNKNDLPNLNTIDVTVSLEGLKAKDWKEFVPLYKKHAAAFGFNTRLSTQHVEEGIVFEKYLVCSCGGKPPKEVKRKRMNDSKTECKAHLRIKLVDGVYVVADHEMNHNHLLTRPIWQYMHRSERSISKEKGEAIKVMDAAGIKPTAAYSPNASPVTRVWSPSFDSPSTCLYNNSGGGTLLSPQMNSGLTCRREDPPLNRQLSFEDENQQCLNPGFGHPVSSDDLMKILSGLEFRKLFMFLSYTTHTKTRKRKLEKVLTLNDAKAILSMNNYTMPDFESAIWELYGEKYCGDSSFRNLYYDWECGKTHLYYCIYSEEGYYFKGPSLSSAGTHLQTSLGDDNVLIVKFLGNDSNAAYMKEIARKGISVGQKIFKFFVYKDERKAVKKNGEDKTFESNKCYFVHVDSGRSIIDARKRFMHVHTLPTIEKYMARFSLILSKTITFPLNWNEVQIVTIDDIYMRDENNNIKRDYDGKPLMFTDGTGYISEDLAMECPKDKVFKAGSHNKRPRNNEPPLLIQCRLFYNGYAVKGTLLLNKKLKNRTIQVRPSMIKVNRDKEWPGEDTFNSFEINSVSRRPGRSFLSKNLIALLSYGGVPQKFFLDLLTAELEDTRNIYSDKRVAFKVASNNDGLEYGSVAQRMISSGIPLDEPYLQHCLSKLASGESKKLKEGRIPIEHSFYLIGTADPTGLLDNNEVFVIHEHGPIMGKVLVYRNPGLHFGDIHVMNAVYKKELEDYIGHSKYGIFFSTKGPMSAAYEIATGDFDGDTYWVSKHPVLLSNFKASDPWKEPKNLDSSRKLQPSDLPKSPQLEHELFRLFLESSKSSSSMATACHSWLSFMDRILVLPDECESEKNKVKEKMNRLINIYYDALDAPKSGKKVDVPPYLKAEKYPHYMNKKIEPSFHSYSILGKIYDSVEAFQKAEPTDQEIHKLPCFDIKKFGYVSIWEHNYANYRREMSQAMGKDDSDEKNESANGVVERYKQLFYGADEFERSSKSVEQLEEEALAIYHATYNHVIETRGKVSLCGFAWKIAGTVLCEIHASKVADPKEKPIRILPSMLREML